jgi:tetratricopeptide (TPR) repeat protein
VFLEDRKERVVRTVSILTVLVLISCTAAYGGEFVLKGDTGLEEIAVRSGEEFRVSIEGAGWYLNRYDRQRLKFRYRTVDPAMTSFVIMPLQAGEGYLLFSLLKADVYVRVIVDGGGSPEGPEEKASAKIEGSAPVAALEGSRSTELKQAGTAVSEEATAAGKDDTETVGESPESAGRVRPARDSEEQKEMPALRKAESGPEPVKDTVGIYYTDEDDRVVPVPVQGGEDERYEYKKGAALYNRKRFSEAAERLVRYLDLCGECEYKIDASMKLAESLVAVGRGKEAIPYLDAVIDSQAGQYHERAYVLRGDIYYGERSPKEALRSYRGALDSGAESVEILRRVGDLHYELNDYGSALAVYERLTQLNAVDDSLLFRVATIYDSPGEPRNVEKAYSYYKHLVAEYGKSEYCAFAVKRIDFLEKNFFNYK